MTRLTPLLIVSTIALAAGLGAQGVDRPGTEAQAARATERLRALQREADALASQERTLLGELRQLELDREIQTEKLGKIDLDLDDAARGIGETTTRIEALEGQLAAARPLLKSRLVELYKLGSGGYARLLLGVNDLQQIGRAYRTAAVLAALDQRRLEEYGKRVQALRDERTALERRRSSMAALQREARSARARLDRAITSRETLVEDTDARRDLNARLAGELQAAQSKLQQTLAALVAGRPADAVVLPLGAFQHDLDWPASGRVTARFGRPAGPGASSSSNGIEIAAPQGDGVRAIHEGTVAYAGPFTGYGNLVIVDHGAQAYSLYGRLAALEVEEGDRVSRGELLGAVGLTPTGGPALYFELRIDGRPVDPIEWLEAR